MPKYSTFMLTHQETLMLFGLYQQMLFAASELSMEES